MDPRPFRCIPRPPSARRRSDPRRRPPVVPRHSGVHPLHREPPRGGGRHRSDRARDLQQHRNADDRVLPGVTLARGPRSKGPQPSLGLPGVLRSTARRDRRRGRRGGALVRGTPRPRGRPRCDPRSGGRASGERGSPTPNRDLRPAFDDGGRRHTRRPLPRRRLRPAESDVPDRAHARDARALRLSLGGPRRARREADRRGAGGHRRIPRARRSWRSRRGSAPCCPARPPGAWRERSRRCVRLDARRCPSRRYRLPALHVRQHRSAEGRDGRPPKRQCFPGDDGRPLRDHPRRSSVADLRADLRSLRLRPLPRLGARRAGLHPDAGAEDAAREVRPGIRNFGVVLGAVHGGVAAGTGPPRRWATRSCAGACSAAKRCRPRSPKPGPRPPPRRRSRTSTGRPS